jgi:hypothetical protein
MSGGLCRIGAPSSSDPPSPADPDPSPDRAPRPKEVWPEAKTLDQYVVSLILKKQTQGREFKALLEIYGRDKLLAIWEAFKKKKQGEKNP